MAREKITLIENFWANHVSMVRKRYSPLLPVNKCSRVKIIHVWPIRQQCDYMLTNDNFLILSAIKIDWKNDIKDGP